MSTPTFRAPVPEETSDLVRFFDEVERHDGGEDHLGADDVEEYFANPMVSAGDDWFVAELDGGIVGTSYLWPRSPSDGEVDLTLIGMVHPGARGRGIGTAMLERMLARVPAYVEELGGDLRAVVRGFTLADNEPAHQLLLDHGFAETRWSFLMQVDLGAASEDEPTLPAGYVLSTWEGLEADELRAAHNLAFGGYHPGFTPWDEHMWTQFVTGAHSYRPALSLVARAEDGSIAAYAHIAEYSGVTEATGVREVFVAKLGTTPDHRRRGLGTTLLSIALRRSAAVGVERATLEVEAENPTGALGVYERAGFETVLRYRHYELA